MSKFREKKQYHRYQSSKYQGTAEDQKIEPESDRVVQVWPRQVRDDGLPKVCHALRYLLKFDFPTSTTAKKIQQVNARGSTVNNVRGDQINIVVNNPTTSAYIEEVEESKPLFGFSACGIQVFTPAMKSRR
jgi:hypothetical protein